MNRVNEMIYALRKCAKQHENEVVYTGQIVTSSLCRDVADYLETDRWHYPSRGEYPKKWGHYLVAICIQEDNTKYIDMCIYEDNNWIKPKYLPYEKRQRLKDVYAWMPLPDPPKEEA